MFWTVLTLILIAIAFFGLKAWNRAVREMEAMSPQSKTLDQQARDKGAV